jgi:hypothetical protein
VTRRQIALSGDVFSVDAGTGCLKEKPPLRDNVINYIGFTVTEGMNQSIETLNS